jgi:hypothetical protein
MFAKGLLKIAPPPNDLPWIRIERCLVGSLVPFRFGNDAAAEGVRSCRQASGNASLIKRLTLGD